MRAEASYRAIRLTALNPSPDDDNFFFGARDGGILDFLDPTITRSRCRSGGGVVICAFLYPFILAFDIAMLKVDELARFPRSTSIAYKDDTEGGYRREREFESLSYSR